MDTIEPLRVLCVDRDPDILAGLRRALVLEPDFEMIASTTDSRAVQHLVLVHRPEVLILGHDAGARSRIETGWQNAPTWIPVLTGLELVEGARSIVPDATIVIFSDRQGLVEASRHAGADLCIQKPAVEELWPAIRTFRACRFAFAGRHEISGRGAAQR